MQEPTQSRNAEARQYKWLTLLELRPGMKVAKPATGMRGEVVTMQVPVGSVLTVESIAQMMVHNVDCVAVFVEGPESEAGESTTLYNARLEQIFGSRAEGGARNLFEALRSCGPE